MTIVNTVSFYNTNKCRPWPGLWHSWPC